MYSKLICGLKDEKIISRFILCLLIAQPILDIISYFAIEYGVTTITSLLRMAMFACIFLWAFVISKRKKIYYVVVGIISLFWLIHVAINWGNGYISIFQDTSMYIRTVQGPMLALAFITFLKQSPNACEQIGKAFFINYVTITLSIILSYVVKMPVYTYGGTKIGLKGWFYTGNSQSCIIAIMAMLAISYAYRQQKKLLFLFTVVVVFANLYFFGTRVAYYSIYIVAIVFVVLLLWNKEKDIFAYGTIVVCLIACMLAYQKSPCYIQQYKVNISFQDNDQMIHDIVDNTQSEGTEGTDGTEDTEIETETEEAHSEQGLKKYEGVYRTFCSDLVERFGLERVVKKFNYSLYASDILNNRKLKTTYCSLVMDEQNVLTKLFGYEYLNMIGDNGKIYDPENDFPALFYLYGHIGVALYVAFILYFVIVALKSVLLNIKNVSIEKGALGVSLILMLGCAELSGNVLRRPNVSIYLSVMLAYLFVICIKENRTRKNSDKKSM